MKPIIEGYKFKTNFDASDSITMQSYQLLVEKYPKVFTIVDEAYTTTGQLINHFKALYQKEESLEQLDYFNLLMQCVHDIYIKTGQVLEELPGVCVYFTGKEIEQILLSYKEGVYKEVAQELYKKYFKGEHPLNLKSKYYFITMHNSLLIKRLQPTD